MTEIKRLNYFTSQFLVEKDFKDEQAYHRRMRHLHNRSLHTWGVVTGLEINKSGDKQVSVNNGMAIDSNGQEIVVLDEQPTEIKTVSLSEFPAGSTVYITLAAQDFEDEEDRYTLGSEIKYTRTTERPQLEPMSTKPADDGAVILLAEVKLDDSGNVVDTIDNSVRRLASVHIPPGAEFSGPLRIQEALNVDGNVSIDGNLNVTGTIEGKLADSIVGNVELADGAVNSLKLSNNAVATDKIQNGAVTNEKIADNAVNAAKIQDGTIGTNELANGAVTKQKISNNAVSIAQLSTELISSGTISVQKERSILIETTNYDRFYLISCRVVGPNSVSPGIVNWYQRSQISRNSRYSSVQQRYLVFDNPGSTALTVRYAVHRLSTT